MPKKIFTWKPSEHTNAEIIQFAKDRPYRVKREEKYAHERISAVKDTRFRRQAFVFLNRYPNITADEALAMARNSLRKQHQQIREAWGEYHE